MFTSKPRFFNTLTDILEIMTFFTPLVNKPAFTFVDLFAGVGGFHYALSAYNGECVWASEWDKTAAKMYETNHHLTPAGDITTILEENIPEHDLLAAGFPCQAFSVSGNQNGFNDPRGTLFFDIARIVKHHQPKIVFLENVRNFQKHDSGQTLKTVQTVLENLGYNFYGQLYNTSNFGLPQNRQRYIMVALRKDIDVGNSFVFPTPPNTDVALEDILETVGTEKYVVTRADTTLHPDKYLTERINKPRQVGKIALGRQGERIYDPKGHAITLSAYGGGIGAKTGLYLIDGKTRKLTPRECARLQGFPESFILPVSDQASWKIFGNSVPINMLKTVVEALQNQNFLP
jgi:DNA (cytosine-5)-methyltransferase 1